MHTNFVRTVAALAVMVGVIGNTGVVSVDYSAQPGIGAYEYGSGNDHPNRAGNEKTTGEFVQLLNVFYDRWIAQNGELP